MTVNEMLNRMSAVEFDEWMAYSIIEPFGPIRQDKRAGEIVAMLANVYRDKKKHPNQFMPADFFPEINEQRLRNIIEAIPIKGETIEETDTPEIPPNQIAANKLRFLYKQPAGFRGRK